MKTIKLNEFGYKEALFGIGLSYGITSGKKIEDIDEKIWEKLDKIATRLFKKEGGHNKFLETMTVIIDLDAPRYLWVEFDTYRVGMTKQSESTIHTAMDHMLTQRNFEYEIDPYVINILNTIIFKYKDCKDKKEKKKLFMKFKNHLPEGFLQRRIISTNYKTLRNIIYQRTNHEIPQWEEFIDDIRKQVDHPTFLYTSND